MEVAALPEIGRSSIRGSTSAGIDKRCKIGVKRFVIRSIRPEFRNALIAKNKPTNVGKIFITVFIPSFAPF